MERAAHRIRAIVFAGAMVTACGGHTDLTNDSPGDPLDTSPQPSEPPSNSDVALSPYDTPTFCTSGSSGDEPDSEFYFERMNEKLQTYPELRDLVGFEAVTSCDTARDFLEQYREYASENPGFDTSGPSQESPAEQPELPEDLPDEQEMEKIYQGQGAVNLPVVELFRWNTNQSPPKRRGPCTGFFISKHFIVTANHCTTADGTWGQYQVTRKNNFSNFTYLKSSTGDSWVWLRQYRFPGWLGASDETSDSGRDMALLYVDSRIHNQLPNPATANSAMRISVGSLTSGEPFSIFGWGVREATGQPPRDLLSAPASLMATDDVTPEFFTANATSTARTCAGDSGGPATRVINSEYVAIGSHVGPFPPGNQPNCPPVGLRLDWCRTADKLSWVNTTLRKVYGSSFSCKTSGSGADTVAKCW